MSGQAGAVALASGLMVINIDDPTNPVIDGNYSFATHNPQGVSISGDVALVDGFLHVELIDIRNPRTMPKATGSISFPVPHNGRNPSRFEFDGNVAFAIHDNTGLHAIDFTNPAAPIKLGNLNPAPEYHHISIAIPQGSCLHLQSCLYLPQR